MKVGPIVLRYEGVARFVELDEVTHKMVLSASGRDARGQSNASATITAKLEPDGEGTKASVVTDLTVTGRVAEFGRGVLADVSSKLLGQFVDALEMDLSAGPATMRETDASTGGDRRVDSVENAPVDLIGAARGPLMKFALPLAATVIAVLAFLRRRLSRKRPAHSSESTL